MTGAIMGSASRARGHRRTRQPSEVSRLARAGAATEVRAGDQRIVRPTPEGRLAFHLADLLLVGDISFEDGYDRAHAASRGPGIQINR
jgi:hypothetical protein